MLISDKQKKLLELIKCNKSVEDIKGYLELSNKELIYQVKLLKDKGYSIKTNCNTDGNVIYFLENSVDYLKNDVLKMYSLKKDDSLRFLVISDLHWFHTKDNKKAINDIYNYAIKNNIHIILNCGDLIDCLNSNCSIEKQINSFIKNYPYDKSILNIAVLGNHDFFPIRNFGIDFMKIIEKNRLDILPIGYRCSKILVKNDAIYLYHPINNYISSYDNERSNSINFIGHSHVTKIKDKFIYVPSLSNVDVYNNKDYLFSPSALDVVVNFDSKRTIASMVVDHINVNDYCYVLSEHILNINDALLNNNLEVNNYGDVKKRIK